MATWQEIKSFIYSKYPISSDSGTTLTIRFDLGDGRSQSTMVGYIDADEWSTLIFSSPFAKVGAVSADRVLQAAESVQAGVTTYGGEFYAVTNFQLASTVDEPEIHVSLSLVTMRADEMEVLLGLGDRF